MGFGWATYRLIRFSIAGAICLAVAIAMIVLNVQFHTNYWIWTAIGLFALSAIFFGLGLFYFCMYASHRYDHHHHHGYSQVATSPNYGTVVIAATV